MKWIFALLCLFGCDVANAQMNKTDWFMEENELWKEDNIAAANITENEFNSILTEIENIYTPIFKRFGATFNLEREWSNSTVNAWANQSGNIWTIHMYGGMARRSELNVAGFALVACHEIGHHLAGWPQYSDSMWAANEGQSDYYANMICAQQAFSSLPVPSVTQLMRDKCDGAWAQQSQREACYKGLGGGLALGSLLAKLHQLPAPKFETPDTSVVTTTSDSHPAPQCRLDSYLAGGICNKSYDQGKIPSQDGAVCTNRPRCWFARSGDGDPEPPNPPEPPTPEPDLDALKVMEYMNEWRSAYGRAMLKIDPLLSCAAEMHAKDVGPAKKCSHVGTNNSTFGQRKRACGRTEYAVEMMTCNVSSPEAAIAAWNRSQSNFYTYQTPYYKKFGCAKSNKIYVCVVGL
jgi:hypothetical protein